MFHFQIACYDLKQMVPTLPQQHFLFVVNRLVHFVNGTDCFQFGSLEVVHCC